MQHLQNQQFYQLYQKNYPFWEYLTEKEKQLFCMQTIIKQFSKGENIDRMGQCSGLVLIKSGKMRIVLLSEEGREVTLFRLGAGDICVFTARCVLDEISFDVVIEAEERLELCVVNSQIFNNLVNQNIYLKSFSYQLAVKRFSDAMWTLQQILFMRADKRLATLLYKEVTATSSNEIKMTHEQLARDMGSAREVVTRLLKYFADEEIVELSRGVVRIVDSEKLLAIKESK